MQDTRIKFIHFTPHFLRALEKLPHQIQSLTKKKDDLFRRNPFDPRLHTHKLKGELDGSWSYSINQKYRLIFRFLGEEEVIYYDIGTHDIYR